MELLGLAQHNDQGLGVVVGLMAWTCDLGMVMVVVGMESFADRSLSERGSGTW